MDEIRQPEYTVGLMWQQLDYLGDDPLGYLSFAHQWQRDWLPIWVEQRHLVGIARKARAGLADVVGYHQVELFYFELAPGIGQYVLGFGGKTHQHLRVPRLLALARDSFEDVSGWFELD